MATYHLSPTRLPQMGRRISAHQGYTAVRSAVRPGEALYLWLDNGIRQIAPCIPDGREWNVFYQQYCDGWWLDCAAYAVPQEETWT